VFGLTDSLVKTDRFMPEIKADEDKIQQQLAPLEKELQEMADKLRPMSPQEEEAQKLYRELQRKQGEAQQIQQKLVGDHERMVGRKYVEAFNLVKASCEGVAKAQGYSHVIGSRTREDIQTDSPSQIAQAILARLVIVSPEGTDITEAVKKDL